MQAFRRIRAAAVVTVTMGLFWFIGLTATQVLAIWLLDRLPVQTVLGIVTPMLPMNALIGMAFGLVYAIGLMLLSLRATRKPLSRSHAVLIGSVSAIAVVFISFLLDGFHTAMPYITGAGVSAVVGGLTGLGISMTYERGEELPGSNASLLT